MRTSFRDGVAPATYVFVQATAVVISIAVGYGDFGAYENWFADIVDGKDVYASRDFVYGPTFFVFFFSVYQISEPLCLASFWVPNAVVTWFLKRRVDGKVGLF